MLAELERRATAMRTEISRLELEEAAEEAAEELAVVGRGEAACEAGSSYDGSSIEEDELGSSRESESSAGGAGAVRARSSRKESP